MYFSLFSRKKKNILLRGLIVSFRFVAGPPTFSRSVKLSVEKVSRPGHIISIYVYYPN